MARDDDFFVYMTTNHAETVLYIGVTSDLVGRVWEHQHGEGSKFTRKYHADRLLFYEHSGDVRDAIVREKQLKGWTRAKKEALIRTMNPSREDITYQLDPHWRRTVEGLASPVSQTRLSTALVPIFPLAALRTTKVCRWDHSGCPESCATNPA